MGASWNIQGWLYYAVDLWQGCPEKGIPNKKIIKRINETQNVFTDFNPANYIWCPRTDIFANGDGYFLYPGMYGPIGSSRLHTIRDGLEDIELLKQIKNQTIRNTYIHQLVITPTNYNMNSLLLEKIRRQIANLILSQK